MFIRHVLNRAAVQAVSLGAALLVVALTNRVLGVGGRGLVAAAGTWTNCFLTIGYASLPIIALNVLPRADDGDARRISGTLLAAGLALGLLTAALGAALYAALGERWFGQLRWLHMALALAPLPAMMAQQNLAAALQARGHLDQFNLLTLLVAGLTVAAVGTALLAGRYDVELALLLQAAVQVAALLATVVLAQRYLPFSWLPSRAWLGRMLAAAAVLHIGSVATFIFFKADLLVVNALLSREATGLYAQAALLATALQVLPMAVQSMLYPRAAAGTLEEGSRRVLHAARVTGQVMLLVALAAAFLAYPAMYVLGGTPFLAAAPLFWLLLPGTVCIAVPIVLNPLWVRLAHYRWLTAVSLLIASAGLGLQLLCVPRWGAAGAALATSLAQLLSLALSVAHIPGATGRRWQEALAWRAEDWRPLAEFLLRLAGGRRPWRAGAL